MRTGSGGQLFLDRCLKHTVKLKKHLVLVLIAPTGGLEDNKITVHLGENAAKDVKLVVNDEIKDILKIVIKSFYKK